MSSLVVPKMEEEFSGTGAVKIPNDPINLDRKAQAIARNSQNCSTTTLVGGWNRATQPPSFSLLPGEILIFSAVTFLSKNCGSFEIFL